jgi:hypothetical protein
MAIDTRAKRQNAAEVGVPLPVSVLPGTTASFEREQVAWSYAGIPAAGLPIGAKEEERIQLGTFSGITPPDIDLGGIAL